MTQERGNRVGFRGVRIEDLVEPRDSQDLCHALGDLAQLEIAASRPRPVQQPHEHARAAAIDVIDLANVEDDERLVGEYTADVLLQGLGLLTGNDPSTARHDGDVANAAGLQRQRHNASSLLTFDGKGHCPSASARRNGERLRCRAQAWVRPYAPGPTAKTQYILSPCARFLPRSFRDSLGTLTPAVGPQGIRFRPVAPASAERASASGILAGRAQSIWASLHLRFSHWRPRAQPGSRRPGTLHQGTPGRCCTDRPTRSILAARPRAGRFALRRPVRDTSQGRRTSIALWVLSWPQQPVHVAPRGPRATPGRSRRARRHDAPLDDDDSSAAVATSAQPDPERSRYLALMERALTAAISALAPRDRLRLASYLHERDDARGDGQAAGGARSNGVPSTGA